VVNLESARPAQTPRDAGTSGSNLTGRLRCIWCCLIGAATICYATAAMADPPARVARVAYASDEVTFSPAGEDQWVAARLNRPLVAGDRLWSAAHSRAELQLDDGVLWLGDETSLNVTDIGDQLAQFELPQGTLSLWVRHLPHGHAVEIDTPNLAFSVTHPGRYRLEVDPQSQSTTVAVRDGQADVYGEGSAYVIDEGQAYRFSGTDLRNSDAVAVPPDAFDRWTASRAARFGRPASIRYVSPAVIGYEDLDDYGVWRAASPYGHVWYPREVPANWAPYRYGHWAWIDPWGWTWVDDAPWGFAPFHYGRWVYTGGAWGWVPGPAHRQPVYAPALVVFVGGSDLLLPESSEPSIGWFPLGPREIYRPPYPVSERYFHNLNVANTVVSTTVINRVYQDYRRNAIVVDRHDFANLKAPGVLTAMPRDAFARAAAVNHAAVPLPPAVAAKAPLEASARVVPAAAALFGAATLVKARPPAALQRRSIIAKTPPPAQRLPAHDRSHARPVGQHPRSRGEEGTPVQAPLPKVKVVDGVAPPTARVPVGASAARHPSGKAGSPTHTPPGVSPVRDRSGEPHGGNQLPLETAGRPHPDLRPGTRPAREHPPTGVAQQEAHQRAVSGAGSTSPAEKGSSPEGTYPHQGPLPRAEPTPGRGRHPSGEAGEQMKKAGPAHRPEPPRAVPPHREAPRHAAPHEVARPEGSPRSAPTAPPKPPPAARVPRPERPAQGAGPLRVPSALPHPVAPPHAAGPPSTRPGPASAAHAGTAPQHAPPAASHRPASRAAPPHPRPGQAPDHKREEKGG
jgi:hypothetical protein